MLLRNIKTGVDMEVFIQHKVTGEIVSAEGMIPGTKKEPRVFDPNNRYFATSLDNVLAEFCIPPTTNREQFFAYLQKGLQYINSILPDDYCTAIYPAAILDSKWLQTEQARVFGCEPDFNAYQGNINIKPECDNKNLRSAAGHIHISYEGATPFDEEKLELYEPDPFRCTIIKALDLFLSIPLVVMEPDNQRKQLYGKAGAFRPKQYGLEYRTISNYYLQTKELTYWAHDAVMAAIDWLNAGNILPEYLGDFMEKTINTCDKQNAQELINELQLKVA